MPSAANKRLAHQMLHRIAEATPATIDAALEAAYPADASWRGSHPLNEMTGPAAMAAKVWRPLIDAFPDLERRDVILMGGTYEGHDLVATVGHYYGTFRRDWLGIPATGRTVTLRYGEVHRMENGKIVQTTALWDVLDVMRQAGFWPLGPSLGTEGLWPAPLTTDGVMLDEQDPAISAANFAQMRHMQVTLGDHGDIATMGRDAMLIPSQVDPWHPKMMWYGPSGIGATRGVQGFVDYHRMPWRKAFRNAIDPNHYIRIGDGNYTATGGWPSLTTEHYGAGFLGLPATGRLIKMRVMDFYLHHEGLIRENWIPMDVLHILLQIDVDVFARMQSFFRRGALG